jgi:hypothetical protein
MITFEITKSFEPPITKFCTNALEPDANHRRQGSGDDEMTETHAVTACLAAIKSCCESLFGIFAQKRSASIFHHSRNVPVYLNK